MHVFRDVIQKEKACAGIRPPIVFSPMPWFGSSLARLWSGEPEPKATCFGWPVPSWDELKEDARCFCVQVHTSKPWGPDDEAGMKALKGPLAKHCAAILLQYAA